MASSTSSVRNWASRLPGVTLVCGDSHTSTHGAFGAIAFGIGASECECVFATQTLRQRKQKTMRVTLHGALPDGVAVKDIILALIARIGTNGGVGYAIEYAGPAIADSVDGSAHDALQHVDRGRQPRRHGRARRDDVRLSQGPPLAPARRRSGTRPWPIGAACASDRRRALRPRGANSTSRRCRRMSRGAPTPARPRRSPAAFRTLRSEPGPGPPRQDGAQPRYMGLTPGMPLDRHRHRPCLHRLLHQWPHRGSAASPPVVAGRRVAPGVAGIVVPGSASVRLQAEAEGLDRIFLDAGFEWRDSGCSMCVAMNDDRLKPGERCASTSNRNFEGRQGQGGRTHLMSPAMAAAAAITGHLVDVRDARAAPLTWKSSRRIESVAAPLPEADIDTDVIFPARFLLLLDKAGLGKHLFHERRYRRTAGRPISCSTRPPFDKARILVADANFGSGSSREQAVWALADFGIRCVIAPSFGEIFYGNCFKNGVLPIVVTGERACSTSCRPRQSGERFVVDLEAQTVDPARRVGRAFDIDPYRRRALLLGPRRDRRHPRRRCRRDRGVRGGTAAHCALAAAGRRPARPAVRGHAGFDDMTRRDLPTNYQGAFGKRIGFGKRPALIMIDFVEAYFDKSCALYAGVEDALASAIRLQGSGARGRRSRSSTPTSSTTSRCSTAAASTRSR